MIKVKKTKLSGPTKKPIEVIREEDPDTGGLARMVDGDPTLTARGRENGWEIVPAKAAKPAKKGK